MSARRQILCDERGLEVVEWIALGVMMLVLIGGVDATLNQNSQLRNAIAAGTRLYAVNFGRDIAGHGPAIPPRPNTSIAIGDVAVRGDIVDPSAPPAQAASATFSQEIIAPNLLPASASAAAIGSVRAPVVLDRRSGSYMRLDPTSQARIIVSPADRVQATVDTTTGQIVYVAPARHTIATLDPLNNRATLIDPVTDVRTNADLETLWRLGIVVIRRDESAAHSVWIARPAVGVPALLSGWR
jgi:hypothetical protein